MLLFVEMLFSTLTKLAIKTPTGLGSNLALKGPEPAALFLVDLSLFQMRL